MYSPETFPSNKRNFPNIAADTVALTETANNFSQSFEGTHSPRYYTTSVKLKDLSVV